MKDTGYIYFRRLHFAATEGRRRMTIMSLYIKFPLRHIMCGLSLVCIGQALQQSLYCLSICVWIHYVWISFH